MINTTVKIENYIPATLLPKIEQRSTEVVARIRRICSRADIPRDIEDGLIADYTDYMAAKFDGFHLSPEQMRVLRNSTTGNSTITNKAKTIRVWRGVGDVVLFSMILEYWRTENAVDAYYVSGNTKHARDSFLPQFLPHYVHEPLSMAARYAVLKRIGKPVEEATIAQARYSHYAYLLISLATQGIATEEELRAIQPYGLDLQQVPEEDTEVLFELLAASMGGGTPAADSALRNMEYHHMGGRCIEFKSVEADTPQTAPKFNADREERKSKVIRSYQNIDYLLGGGRDGVLEVAERDANGTLLDLRPLRDAVEEKRKAVEAMRAAMQAAEKNHLPAPYQQKQMQEAEQLTDTNITALWQVLDAVSIIAGSLQPDSSSSFYATYIMTPRRITEIATGVEHPNIKEIQNCMRALYFLRTQNMKVPENIIEYVPKKNEDGSIAKDTNGKIIRVPQPRKIITDFMPVVAIFRTEYKENVPIMEATQVALQISNLIRCGKSQDSVEIEEYGKTHKAKITEQRTNYITLAQANEFRKDEEIRFYKLIISREKKEENALLSYVFDYKGQKQKYDTIAQQMQVEYEALSKQPDATAEQIQAAKDKADKAKRAAKRANSHNKGRDIQRLKDMFEKAKSCGIITNFYPNASGTTWLWERPTKKDIEERYAQEI